MNNEFYREVFAKDKPSLSLLQNSEKLHKEISEKSNVVETSL